MENIEEIYKKYANLIKTYIYSITYDLSLAEDIMQETFVIAINQINNFRGDCEIYVWLYSIAKKVLYKNFKKNKFKNIISINDLEISNDIDIEFEYINNNTTEKLYNALQNLDDITRKVMLLRLTENFTFKEIGRLMNKSENWARVTFFRGKQKINKEELV